MKVHLFAVRGESGESLLLDLVPVELDGPFAHTPSLTPGDDVQERRLTGAGRAHEREESLGLSGAGD